MKNLFCISVLTLLSFHLIAQPESSKSSSPYFLVTNEGDATKSLALQSTRVDVQIAGVISDVVVEQTYTNDGNTALEAIYVFPGSTSAAVYGMEMQVGTRILKAKIEEKSKARETYTKAKEQGKRTSLLEQHRPNVFQMNVANIMPGDTIKVRLNYTELLVPENGIYSFVYPTVTGPRYSNHAEKTNVSYAAMPYQRSNETPLYDFALQLRLSAGIPIDFITSNTHQIQIEYPTESIAVATLPTSPAHGNRDFVLQYGLRSNQTESGILLYEHGNEKFFLCVVQPPKRVELSVVPPREYIFVIDVSGSMNGFPMTVTKQLMTDLMNGLRPTDKFNIILFAGGSEMLSEVSLNATSDNLQKAMHLLNAKKGGGGTNLLPALKKSLQLPRTTEGISRSIVVVTDGYVTVEPEAFELVRQNLNQANVFSFGIGSSVNRHLIEGLAHVGQGLPTIILNKNDATNAAEKFLTYISNPVLTQIESSFNGFEAYDVEPISIPDVLSDRPVVIFGKYRGKPEGQIELSGYTGNPNQNTDASATKSGLPPIPGIQSTKVTYALNVSDVKPEKSNIAIKYLWARERLRRLSDYNQLSPSTENIQEITSLGLEYNLLTAYTSFVAVERKRARDQQDSLHTFTQPLPLPEGVSDYAVGFTLSISGVSGQIQSSLLPYLLIGLLTGIIASVFLIRRYKTSRNLVVVAIATLLFVGCSHEDQNDLHTCNTRTTHANKITFILGEDATETKNPYYTKASSYFNDMAKDGTMVVVSQVRSLESLLDYLSNHPSDTGPWEEINLVVHGNRWTGISLPVSDDGEGRLTTEVLQKLMHHQIFSNLPSNIINCASRVNIYGCSLGLDRDFINAFNGLFINSKGEEAMIFASPYFTIFQNSGQIDKIVRYEAECFYIPYSIEKQPDNQALAKAFADKYPKIQINWLEALHAVQGSENQKPFRHEFSIPVEWTFLFREKSQRPDFKWQEDIVSWVAQQEDMSGVLENMNFSPEDFWWTATPATYQVNILSKQPSLKVRGSTRIHCVLVPVASNPDPFMCCETPT